MAKAVTDLEDNLENLELNRIEISKNSHYPDREWKILNYVREKVEKIPLNTPIQENKIRIVCISDTHSRLDKMTHSLPKADILIHAGDLTKRGSLEEFEEFSRFMASLTDIKYKVIIAGNHDKELDPKFEKKQGNSRLARKILEKNCIYLQDSGLKLFGLNIYGSPWQPIHCENGFQLERGKDLLEKWNLIPVDTDILITHGPPLGYGDKAGGQYHVGCVELLNTVIHRVKPKYHIFGHVHEGYGMWTNGSTIFLNAAICNKNYMPYNEPILIDIELPHGVNKSDLINSFENKNFKNYFFFYFLKTTSLLHLLEKSYKKTLPKEMHSSLK